VRLSGAAGVPGNLLLNSGRVSLVAGQHRAGEVVEARLAALAQPALARVSGIVPAVPDRLGAVAGRAPHTGRPAMLADQVEALGVIEQRGQADQVGAQGTFTSAGGASPRSTGHHRLHHTRYRDPTAKHGTAQLITPEPAMSLPLYTAQIDKVGPLQPDNSAGMDLA
jgi:hypothetical protein